MKQARVVALAVLMALPVSGNAGQALPDELTVNVGDVWVDARSATEGTPPALTNVTLVLNKRSMRSEGYVCGIWSDSGFKKMEFPVSTYRGQVEGDPGLRVVANIQPGALLNAYISAGRQHIGAVEMMKIEIPEGKCTPFSRTGNRVVPLKSLPVRRVPTPSGCLVPRVPMRRSKWVITAPKTYTEHSDYETVVSRIEARWNDADHVFARDAGTAWEICTMVLVDPGSTKQFDWDAIGIKYGDPKRMFAVVTGIGGRNSGKGNRLGVSGDGTTASILLHEGAHLHGDWCHQMDPLDGLFGGGAFFGRNNVQILCSVQETTNMWCYRPEEQFPGVIYNGVLPPSAMRDMVATKKDCQAGFDVLENDYDGNGDEIFLHAVSPTSEKGGTVAVSEDKQKAVYAPPPGFEGLDTFTYTVMDSTGAANKSGIVKVDVRPEGLAYYCGFEEGEKDGVDWLIEANDWRMWAYNSLFKTPEAERVTYKFAASGAYATGPARTLWIPYVPVKGIKGNGLLNPVGNPVKGAQVDLSEAGDPGRESLSASIWVLFPDKPGGVILSKASYGGKTLVCGWAILAKQQGFSFLGNTVRLLGNKPFELHSEAPIASNTWYHLVMVMDRKAKKLRAYVNSRALTATSSADDIADEVIEYHDKMRLFNPPAWKSWGTRPMLVDEVKIFAEALTPKQVSELYAEGKDAPAPKLPPPVVKE